MTEVRYTVEVYITRQVEHGDDPSDYLAQQAKTSIERTVIRALKVAWGREADVDAETMQAELLRDAEPDHGLFNGELEKGKG